MMPPARATAAYGSLLASQELFRADGLTISASSDTVTAAVKNQVTGPVNNGSGPENLGPGLIDVSAAGNGLLIVSVGAVSGTSPGLEFFLDVQDAYGHWVAVATGATGILSASVSVAGTYAGALSTAMLAAYNGRLRWTVTGTTPSFTGVSLNVYGR